MASEFAVPMMGAMGAVILAGINEDMAMPAYMMLGSIAMLIALLLAAGAVTLPLNSIQALAFVPGMGISQATGALINFIPLNANGTAGMDDRSPAY